MTSTQEIASTNRQKERERNQRERQQASRPLDGGTGSGSSGSNATALFGNLIKSEQNDEISNRIRSTLGDFGNIQELLLNNPKQIIGVSTHEINKINGQKARIQKIFAEMKAFPPLTGLDDDEDIDHPPDTSNQGSGLLPGGKGRRDDMSLSGLSEDDSPLPLKPFCLPKDSGIHNHKSQSPVKKPRRNSDMNGNIKVLLEDSSSDSSASSSSDSDSESGSSSSSSEDEDLRLIEAEPAVTPEPSHSETKQPEGLKPQPTEINSWSLSEFVPINKDSQKKGQPPEVKSLEPGVRSDKVQDVIEAVARGPKTLPVKRAEESLLTTKRKTFNSSSSLLTYPLPSATKKACDLKDVKAPRSTPKKSQSSKVKSPTGSESKGHSSKCKQSINSSKNASASEDAKKVSRPPSSTVKSHDRETDRLPTLPDKKLSDKQKENFEPVSVPKEIICSIDIELLKRIPSRIVNEAEKTKKPIKEVTNTTPEAKVSPQKAAPSSTSGIKRKPEITINGSSSSRKKVCKDPSPPPPPPPPPPLPTSPLRIQSKPQDPTPDRKHVSPPSVKVNRTSPPHPESRQSQFETDRPIMSGGGRAVSPLNRRTTPNVAQPASKMASELLGSEASSESQYTSDYFLTNAKRLKHAADKESDQTMQLCKYLESTLFFISTGNAMEAKSSDIQSLEKMYKDTLNLIRTTTMRIMKCRQESQPEMLPKDHKLNALSLRCQSLLSLRLWRLKSKEMREYYKMIQTLQSEAVVKEGTATLPASLYQTMHKQLQLYGYLNSAHEIWNQAEIVMEKQPSCKAFFTTLDSERRPLSLTSSLDDLVNYVKTGLKLLG